MKKQFRFPLVFASFFIAPLSGRLPASAQVRVPVGAVGPVASGAAYSNLPASSGSPVALSPVSMTLLRSAEDLAGVHLSMPEMSAAADNLRAVAKPLLEHGDVMVLRAPDAAALVSVKNPTLVGWVAADPAQLYATASMPWVRDYLVQWTLAMGEGAVSGDYKEAHAFLRRAFDLSGR